MKRISLIAIIVVCILTVLPFTALAANYTNRAWSDEFYKFPLWWGYEGHIQFNPSYTVPADPGYNLEGHIGKNIKRAYINYVRDGESVIGGRKYTLKATSASQNVIYSASATAQDNLLPWGPKTEFKYGWEHF